MTEIVGLRHHHRLIELKLSHSIDGFDSVTILVAHDELPVEHSMKRIRFEGVQQLRIDSEPTLSTPLILVIEDLRGRGWEELRYRVEDVEHLVAFYCASYETSDLVGPFDNGS